MVGEGAWNARQTYVECFEKYRKGIWKAFKLASERALECFKVWGFDKALLVQKPLKRLLKAFKGLSKAF